RMISRRLRVFHEKAGLCQAPVLKKPLALPSLRGRPTGGRSHLQTSSCFFLLGKVFVFLLPDCASRGGADRNRPTSWDPGVARLPSPPGLGVRLSPRFHSHSR